MVGGGSSEPQEDDGFVFRNSSSSQIETARLCLRKWWFDKVAALKQPPKSYFVIGDRLHSMGERVLLGSEELYLLGWDDDLDDEQAQWLKDVTRIAIQKDVWPQNDLNRVEVPICMLIGESLTRYDMPLLCKAEVKTSDKGIRYIDTPQTLIDGSPLPDGHDELPYFAGFIDHWIPYQSRIPEIWDHKTAKNLRYRKRKKQIKEAVQALVYPCFGFAQFPYLDRILFGYNVFIKDLEVTDPDKRVYTVFDHITKSEAAKHWQRTIADIRVMAKLAQDHPRVGGRKDPERGANWKDVPGAMDPKACEAYGGCHCKDLCMGRCNHIQLANQLEQKANQAQGPIALNAKLTGADASG